MSKLKRRLEYHIKHNRLLNLLYTNCLSLGFRALGLFVRIHPKTILFSGLGKRYSDSPKAIFEYMRDRGLTKEYRCIWALEDTTVKIDGAEVVKLDSLKYFITALQAKYWVAAVNIERGLHFKKKKTVFLNTWHGAAINAMGNALGARSDFDWRKTDFVCCSGDYEKEILIRDCRALPEALIETGLPRNDRLYRATEEEKAALRASLGLPSGKRVALYAPTWRDASSASGDFVMAPPIDWSALEKALGEDYVIAVHSHWITESFPLPESDFVLDYSTHPDINDLMIASDLLISDYSSIILDYSILGRPIVCFGYDFDQYTATRPLYFDAEATLPGGVVRTEEALARRLAELDIEAESASAAAFRDSHMTYGGEATRLCVEYLLGR